MLRDLFSLFPAYAGVILQYLKGAYQYQTFPRIRGGDPINLTDREITALFSPHTRG